MILYVVSWRGTEGLESVCSLCSTRGWEEVYDWFFLYFIRQCFFSFIFRRRRSLIKFPFGFGRYLIVSDDFRGEADCSDMRAEQLLCALRR